MKKNEKDSNGHLEAHLLTLWLGDYLYMVGLFLADPSANFK